VSEGNAALAGMIGPVIFVLIVIVLTVLQYGFMRGLGCHHRKLRCALAGVALVLLGFKTDPNLLSTGPQTLSGWIHGLAFVLLTLSLLLTFFVMGWGLIKDPLWRRYGWYSLATGILFVVGFFIPGQIGTYIFLTVILAWMFVVALRLGSVAEGASAQRTQRVR
jgi:hypothetical protein